MSTPSPWWGHDRNRGDNSTYPGGNGTYPGGNGAYPGGNSTYPGGGLWNWTRGGGTRPSLLSDDTSYLVATCYLSFLSVVAVVMAARSKTRLRIFALLITVLGLSIAVIGYLRSIYVLGPQWFWCWNFLGESIGVAAMMAIIVCVGSGFYPMTGKRSFLWMVSMGMVCIYAVFATVNIVFYVHEKIVPHAISSDDLQKLRDSIFHEYKARPWDLVRQRREDFEQGKVSTLDYNTTVAQGVANWMDLSTTERDTFARPDITWYLSHQLLMLFTFTWSCIYLFVPLVRNHRHGPVGRPVDSDTMAVGVWYLSSLLFVAGLYCALNIYYVFEPQFIFDQPAQALDLCLRLTVGPVFMLPAPAFLFRFYRQHFKKFRGAGGSGNGGSGGRTTDSSNAQNDCRSYQAGSSRNGGITQFQSSRFANTPRGSFDSHDSRHLDSPSINQKHNYVDAKDEKTYSNPDNVSPQGRLKFFQSRDRGLSVESSRVLSRDFEYEEQTSNYSEDHPDSFHQYYTNMDTHHPLRDSITLGDPLERPGQDYKSPVIAALPAAHVRSSLKNDYSTERAAMDEPDQESPAVQQTVPEDDTLSRSSASTPEPNSTTPIVAPPHAVTNIEELTGLQRQLAEYRADLLPRVIAVKEYHEDLATAEALEMGLKPTSTAYDYDVVLKDANSLTAINDFFEPSPSETRQTEDLRSLPPDVSPSALTLTPLPPIPGKKLRKPASSTALNKDSSAKLSKELKLKDKKILSAFSKAITGNGSKSGHSHSHSNDGNSLDFMDGDMDSHGSFEVNRGPTVFAAGPATVKELAEASATSFGQSEDGTKQSYIYSDPYEDKTGFKKSFQGQDRQALMQSMPKALCPSTGSYSRIDCRTTTPTDIAKLRGSQSAGSLSTARVSDTASQSSNRKIPPIPKDSRPAVSKKSGQQQAASRTSRSKSDAPYHPSAEMRGPSVELPINTYRSPPLAPAALPQPAKTSLSPPPRQSWRRSKSFKGNSPLIAAIDTKLANADASETTEPTSNSVTSASLTSSSQSSPTVGPSSHENTPENHFSSRGEPLSPPVPSFYQDSGSRANSMDPSLNKGTSSGSGSSSAASSLPGHRGISRQQRSIDNLASAYYYKHAAELSNVPASSLTSTPLPNRPKNSLGSSSSSSPSSSSKRDPSNITMPSSLASPSSPSSPQLTSNSGMVNYFPRHQTQASISSSPATSPGLSPGSGPIDRTANGRNSPPYDGGMSEGTRTGSFTKQSMIMAEDPWTMALINRAQAQSSSGSQIPQQPPPGADIYSRPNIARTTSE